MILNIHSDASYLGDPKAKSSSAGHFFLGWLAQDKQPIQLNGPVHILTSILQFVAASVDEEELGALFVNVNRENHLSHS